MSERERECLMCGRVALRVPSVLQEQIPHFIDSSNQKLSRVYITAQQPSWIHPDVSRTLEPVSHVSDLILMLLIYSFVYFTFVSFFLSFFSKVTVLKVPGTVSRNEKDRLKKTPAFA